jgi:hypothetical protein
MAKPKIDDLRKERGRLSLERWGETDSAKTATYPSPLN